MQQIRELAESAANASCNLASRKLHSVEISLLGGSSPNLSPKREKLARLDKYAVDRRCGDPKIDDLVFLELRIRIAKRPAKQRGVLRTHCGQIAILLLIRKILARSKV